MLIICKRDPFFTHLAQFKHFERFSKTELTNDVGGHEHPPLVHVRRTARADFLGDSADGEVNFLPNQRLMLDQRCS